MKVRFGFVAMSLTLKNASPSQTMTFKTFQAITDRDAALDRATRIAQSNLHNTLRILRHAAASGVHLYRFSSKLIPLFTHDATAGWDVFDRLADDFQAIGQFVADHDMRVSFHPDHFTVLNSPKPEIVRSSIRELAYHDTMFKAMRLDEHAKLVMHVGGGYQNKEAALARFGENWRLVPKDIQQRIILENDDKTYTARETQRLAQSIGVPMVFDLHHHMCNQELADGSTGSVRDSCSTSAELDSVIKPFLDSWALQGMPPKAHMSSPKDESNFRAHADVVRLNELLPLLDCVREYNVDLDIMIEAKHKDEALFALMRDFEKLNIVRQLDGGTIDYRP